MTAKAKPLRSSDLAKIHIAKKAVFGADDEAYRAMLHRVARVDSAAALDIAGRTKVLRELERLGWTPVPDGRAKKLCPAPQAKKIRALWLALYAAGVVRVPDESALLAYVRRQAQVERLEWLSAAAASKVIEALKQWCRRAGVEIDP